MRLLAELPASTPATDLRGIEAILALPADTRISVEFAHIVAPGWRALARRVGARARAETDPKGPWHRVHGRIKHFLRQLRGGALVPHPVPFDRARYRATVTALAGQGSVPWPGRKGKRARFSARLMGYPRNDLDGLCDYLVAAYRALGLAVERQPFAYQGRSYSNVVATLPGRSPERIVLVDHFDVAPTADYDQQALAQAKAYGLSDAQIKAIRSTHRTGQPVPGADDNASGTAALLEAAHALARGARPTKTIQFLHLNGEEFPGDSYGAKQFVARALARRDPIVGVLVLDMIGVNRQRDRVFQIAPGPGRLSVALADHAARAARKVAAGFRPVVRLFDDHRSYLYNTDGQVFSAAGFPVLLFNEHLNYHEDLERLGYHDEFDRIELMDWNYAAAIARTAIATAAMGAHDPPRRRLVIESQADLQRPERRAGHFQIELRYSPLYEALLAAEKAAGRPLTDAELARLIRRDLAVKGDPSEHDSSVALRLTTWFQPAGWKPLDSEAILGQLRYLRARDAVYRGAAF